MVVNEIGRGRIESIHTSPGGVPKQSLAAAKVLNDQVQGDDHRESFIDGYSNRISQKLFPRWSRVYIRVLSMGEIRVGDEIVVEVPQ